jgi:hypothetical protein
MTDFNLKLGAVVDLMREKTHSSVYLNVTP